MDTVDRQVKQQIGQATARAYGYRASVTEWDPELCLCQRQRPVEGDERCVECLKEVTA